MKTTPKMRAAMDKLLTAMEAMGPDDRLSDVLVQHASLSTRLHVLAVGARDVQARATTLCNLAEVILASLPPEETKQ